MDEASFRPLDVGILRGQLVAQEEEVRHLAKQLGIAGEFEACCAVRDAADLLLAAGRTLSAERPCRNTTHTMAVLYAFGRTGV
ncbi:hypothetical protein [Streptomyces puniciscabiei]|uniref:hypothetical protein n=1 Tax=Streptomyces puniciscabiei TaxID=164348 RepID=UPI001152DA32|nr:hypothetical protein [Streptomyces puniciscabiei]